MICRLLCVAALLFGCVAGAATQDPEAQPFPPPLRLSTQRLIHAAMQFLTSDAVGDRSAGSEGAEVAAAFIASQFRMLGLEPAGAGGSFLRRMDAAAVASEGVLVIGGPRRTESVAVGEDFVAWPTRVTTSTTADGEMVFAGYGIHAQEYDWDDFADVSVVGKILVVLSGDPGLTDSSRFRGMSGTPYGTLDYKLQEAGRRGARGLIALHDDVRGGTSWSQVQTSRGGEVLLPVGGEPQELTFAAVMRMDLFRSLLATLGRDADVLFRRSELPSFQPIAFGAHAVMRLRSKVREIRLLAAVGRIPGGDVQSQGEAVLITTSYDGAGHTGAFADDTVSTGASSAAGVAVVLGAAGALRQAATVLRRSVYIAAVAGSGHGSMGASELAARPPVPQERIAAVVNVGQPSFGPFPPVVTGIDAVESGIDALLRAAAARSGVSLNRWTGHPVERFSLDHTHFAKRGIPGVTVRGDAAEATDRDSPRSGEGLALQAGFTAHLAQLLADAVDRPAWNPDSPYRDAWDRLERRRMRGAVP